MPERVEFFSDFFFLLAPGIFRHAHPFLAYSIYTDRKTKLLELKCLQRCNSSTKTVKIKRIIHRMTFFFFFFESSHRAANVYPILYAYRLYTCTFIFYDFHFRISRA